MSSTHDPKGEKGYRAESDDFYETPLWCVERLLEAYTPPPGAWLEPCAGRGAIVFAVNKVLPNHAGWTAFDKNPVMHDALAKYSTAGTVLAPTDFLAYVPPRGYDVLMTNPPYKLAPAILSHAVRVSRVTILLLRLSFLATQDRNEFMKISAPDVYVLPDRPSFRGEGKTDSTDYAWFVWDRAVMPRRVGHIRVLNTTPKEIRKR